MNIVDTIKQDGWKAIIAYDEGGSDCNPRQNDNLGTLVCYHRDYELGDKNPYTSRERVRHEGGLPSLEDLKKEIEEGEGALAVCLPVYMIDHSGVALQLGEPFACDPQGWDSGVVGLCYLTKKKLREEYKDDKQAIEKASTCMRAEVEEYGRWLNGEVYYYTIKDPHGEVIDSCGGFIGYEYAEEATREALKDAIEDAQAREVEMEEFYQRSFAL